MPSDFDKFLDNQTFEWQGKTFRLSGDLFSMLHHWHFGTSTEYYRSPNKQLILPDVDGKLVKITDLGAALDKAFHRYNELSCRAYEKDMKK